MSIQKDSLRAIRFPKMLVARLWNQCPRLNLVEQSLLYTFRAKRCQSSDPQTLRPWINSYFNTQNWPEWFPEVRRRRCRSMGDPVEHFLNAHTRNYKHNFLQPFTMSSKGIQPEKWSPKIHNATKSRPSGALCTQCAPSELNPLSQNSDQQSFRPWIISYINLQN